VPSNVDAARVSSCPVLNLMFLHFLYFISLVIGVELFLTIIRDYLPPLTLVSNMNVIVFFTYASAYQKDIHIDSFETVVT
jgi:hypothetical protein